MIRKLLPLLQGLFVFALSLVICLPLLYAVSGAFKTAPEFAGGRFFPASFSNTEAFSRLFSQLPMGQYLLNSIIVALLTGVARILLSVPAAWAFAMYDFKGKAFLFLLVMGTMMLPPDTLLITNYRTVTALNLTDSYLGMGITAFMGAATVFMLRQSIRTMPRPLYEAARVDGCGDLHFIVRILLPLIRPVLVILFLQTLINSWNNYLWPLMVTNKDTMRTVAVGISMISDPEQMDYPLVLAGVTVSVLPVALLFLFFRRRISLSMTDGAVIG